MSAEVVEKSPVALLHELCRKQKLTLQYELSLKDNNQNIDYKLESSKILKHERYLNCVWFAERRQLDAEEEELQKRLKELELDEQVLDQLLCIDEKNAEPKPAKKRFSRKTEHTCKVSVGGDITAIATGLSKKLAKQAAAAVALKQLLAENDLKAATDSSVSEVVSTNSADSVSLGTSKFVDPVSALSQLAHKLYLPTARYELNCTSCVTETGKEKMCTCTASVWDLSLTGTAASKIKAKRAAASQLLQLLQEAAAAVTYPSGSGDNQPSGGSLSVEAGLNGGGCSDKAGLKSAQAVAAGDHIPKFDVTAASLLKSVNAGELSHEMDQHYALMRSRAGKTLASLESVSLNRPHTNFCQMLCEIAEEQKFEIKFTDLPQRTTTGDCQCLAQLSCFPVVGCLGVGHTADDARALAAHNALQFLRVKTQKI